MQVRPNLSFNLSLELAKLVMILVIYAPYAVMARPMPGDRPAIAVAGFGLVLVASLILRNLVVREKAPLWARTLWASGDLLLWALSARYMNWSMPIALAGSVGTADLAMLGWRYRRGLWYWALATAFVCFGPLLLGEPFNGYLLVGYVLPVLPACLFAYLFLRMLANLYEARESAERARKTAELATVQLREYADQLEQMAVLREHSRPDREERSWIDRIRKLVQDFAAATGVHADLVIDGDPLELPAAQSLCLYRAIQEGLANAFRHGRAQSARVRLLFAPGAVTASVEDHGAGARESATTGLGLVGIRERSALLGGTVAAGTAATGGFVLRVTLPLAGGQPTAESEGAQ